MFSSELVVQLTLYIADLTLTVIVVFSEWKNCKESDYESDWVLTNILQAENSKYQNVERCHAGEFGKDFKMLSRKRYVVSNKSHSKSCTFFFQIGVVAIISANAFMP